MRTQVTQATRRVRPMRKGTLRAQVRDVLKRGATREQVERVVEKFDRSRGRKKPANVAARARGAIYLLQSYVGYGVKEQSDGKLKLVERPTASRKRTMH